jgi:TatD DNase family protein
MLIDSHAHLDYEYDMTIPELLAEARAHGIEKVFAIAASKDSLDRVVEIANQYPNVYHTSGIHPHDSGDFTPEIFAKVKANAALPKCIAIGELGLDYYYDNAEKSVQFAALEAQLDFSAEIGKPIVLHTRDADDDTIRFLEAHSKKWHARHPQFAPGVIHCFTGTPRLAEACLALGYYISFSGIITFKNAEDLRQTAKNIVPLDRILVETDSPYLAPIPHRGKKNHPAYTKFVAEKVAELKGMPVEELAKHTTANTLRLFRLTE